MKISDLYKIFNNHPNVTTDTRNIKENSIFFALKGDNFNGNKFARKAIKDGCHYAIIDQSEFQLNEKYILVDDVLKCLQNLATYHRDQIMIPVIGITGTNGKTTSKELIYSCLSTELNTLATDGNYNNHIGVPLTLLRANKEHDIAIIEMGANHENEITYLCEIAKPNYGIITNIGKAHLEGFKNIEGVKKTKKELYDYIKTNKGKIFINNEDTILKEISKDIKIISYGLNGEINGRIKESSIFTNVEFNSQIIETKLIGTYQFYNIMLSIAVSTHFGIKLKNISKALSSYKPSNNRSQVIKTKFNTIILDAYNANPSSMYEMINSFSKIQNKNKICILGDMAELGEYSKKEHLNLIHLLENLKINCLFVGNEFSKLNITGSFFDVENLINYLKKKQIKDSTILVKGSRSIKLEKVIKVL
ncbi:MAG: UDP-N-acetylmuramoyl-tripeptide--D-alanyl-D-alanine ligase [Flavobacteriales bacterium]|nr:UDP-N-acetylmuramoyl-tripeptide--D-alanyl-D-alanine ligase [Flavobacteriales bacterium]